MSYTFDLRYLFPFPPEEEKKPADRKRKRFVFVAKWIYLGSASFSAAHWERPAVSREDTVASASETMDTVVFKVQKIITKSEGRSQNQNQKRSGWSRLKGADIKDIIHKSATKKLATLSHSGAVSSKLQVRHQRRNSQRIYEASLKMKEWQERKTKMRHELDLAKSPRTSTKNTTRDNVRRHSHVGRLNIEGLKADTALYLSANLGTSDNHNNKKMKALREATKLKEMTTATKRSRQLLWLKAAYTILWYLRNERKIRKPICSLPMLIQIRILRRKCAAHFARGFLRSVLHLEKVAVSLGGDRKSPFGRKLSAAQLKRSGGKFEWREAPMAVMLKMRYACLKLWGAACKIQRHVRHYLAHRAVRVKILYLMKVDLTTPKAEKKRGNAITLPPKGKSPTVQCSMMTKRMRELDIHHYRTNALLQIYNLDDALSNKPKLLTARELLDTGIPEEELKACSEYLRRAHHKHLRDHRWVGSKCSQCRVSGLQV
jgi:hypothetical protein